MSIASNGHSAEEKPEFFRLPLYLAGFSASRRKSAGWRYKCTFWARMFTTHQTALTGFFRRRVAHPWDAQDLVQEVSVRLLRIDGGESGNIANPEACLFTVASNLVKEHAVLQKMPHAS